MYQSRGQKTVPNETDDLTKKEKKKINCHQLKSLRTYKKYLGCNDEQ